MSVKVYVITDPTSIEFLENNDVEGFKNYIGVDEYLTFDEPVEFETEQEALCFCSGLGYGVDERGPVEKFPLRSFEEYDQPFIEVIENNY